MNLFLYTLWTHGRSQSILSIYQPGAKWRCPPLCLCAYSFSIFQYRHPCVGILLLFFFCIKSINCVFAHLCVYLHVCARTMQSEHLAPLCSPTLAQTRESVDYWMQLQCAGQTIKIDSAFAFYHTPNIPEVKACEPWAAGILIMIENMPPEWGGILMKKIQGCIKQKGRVFFFFSPGWVICGHLFAFHKHLTMEKRWCVF